MADAGISSPSSSQRLHTEGGLLSPLIPLLTALSSCLNCALLIRLTFSYNVVLMSQLWCNPSRTLHHSLSITLTSQNNVEIFAIAHFLNKKTQWTEAKATPQTPLPLSGGFAVQSWSTQGWDTIFLTLTMTFRTLLLSRHTIRVHIIETRAPVPCRNLYDAVCFPAGTEQGPLISDFF